MRHSAIVASLPIVIASLLFHPVAAAAAQDAAVPSQEAAANGYRVVAIAAGAVAGVIVANILTGGMISPILMAGTGGMPAMAGMVMEPAVAGGAAAVAEPAAVAAVEPAAVAAAPGVMAPVVATAGFGYGVVQAVVLAGGAIIGGYVGNWLYGR
jgi:hypothetical protein